MRIPPIRLLCCAALAALAACSPPDQSSVNKEIKNTVTPGMATMMAAYQLSNAGFTCWSNTKNPRLAELKNDVNPVDCSRTIVAGALKRCVEQVQLTLSDDHNEVTSVKILPPSCSGPLS